MAMATTGAGPGQTPDAGRLWTYARDDRPSLAALIVYSRDRAAEHPERHLQG